MSCYKYTPRVNYDKEIGYKAFFNGNTGLYGRTGLLEKTGEKVVDTGIDPFNASFPELIDIGIMERCVCSSRCNVGCYQKACDRTGENMSLSDFQRIIDECKSSVFQVALGGAGDPDTHENFAEILRVCAEANIVPNFTTSGICMTSDKAKLCKEYCGAVAVSEHFSDYTDKAVKMLLKNGVKTNIHYVLSKLTINTAINILKSGGAYKPGINAVIFLLYKPVGLGDERFVLKPTDEEVQEFFKALDTRRVNFKIGFDSCSSSGLINFSNTYKTNKNNIDFCEGARFSLYISADMHAMPCSFANQDKKWHYKLDSEHSIKDAWNSEIFETFRTKLKSSCPGCDERENCGGGCHLMDNINLCTREERTT